MPDESCRNCGGDLVKCSLCVECRKVIQKICRMCSLRTEEEIHPKCLFLDDYQTRSERNTVILVNNHPHIRADRNKNFGNYLPKILLVIGLVGISIMGVGGMVYLDSSHHPKVQDPPLKTSNNSHFVVVNEGTNPLPYHNKEQNYNNCLGSSNGNYLLIKCPTDSGSVHRLTIEIPPDLISQFESKVFSIRGFSLNENSNSISIAYKNKVYTSNPYAN